MTETFDKTTKRSFRSVEEPAYIKFGTFRDKDIPFGIRSGQLKLAGRVTISVYPSNLPMSELPNRSEVPDLFEPSIQTIIDAIERQLQAATSPVTVSSDTL